MISLWTQVIQIISGIVEQSTTPSIKLTLLHIGINDFQRIKKRIITHVLLAVKWNSLSPGTQGCFIPTVPCCITKAHQT